MRPCAVINGSIALRTPPLALTLNLPRQFSGIEDAAASRDVSNCGGV